MNIEDEVRALRQDIAAVRRMIEEDCEAQARRPPQAPARAPDSLLDDDFESPGKYS